MKKLLSAALVAAFVLLIAGRAGAEIITGLTINNSLLSFESTNPAFATPLAPVTGLFTGETLFGISTRPSDGQLYGVSIGKTTGHVYRINYTPGASTAAATLVSSLTDTNGNNVLPSGQGFGVNFNPVANLLRVVSNTGQNLRINVDNGLTNIDGAIAYAANDPTGGGTPAQSVAVAYTNNNRFASTTTLYNIEKNLNNLTTQNPPNNGILNSVNLLNPTADTNTAFGISGVTQTAYAVFDGVTLSTINLANGDVLQLGSINTQSQIIGIAVPVPEPASLLLVGVAGAGACRVARRKRSV